VTQNVTQKFERNKSNDTSTIGDFYGLMGSQSKDIVFIVATSSGASKGAGSYLRQVLH
jgi:hypothetical protein